MTYLQQESPDAVALNPREKPTAAVIWLHGLGADGFDFVPIVSELRLPQAVRFVFPHAAMRPVTINNGYVMRAWYDILGFGPGHREDDSGVRESGEIVTRYIEREAASGIPAARVILAGFSQGGAVALHTALRYPQRLGGVLALSTYLPLRSTVAAEAAAANRTAPILMCHGVRDGVVPVALGEASRDVLRGLGYSVDWRSYPMEHQVCMEEIADIAQWMQGILMSTRADPRSES